MLLCSLTQTSICLGVIIAFLASATRSGAEGYALHLKYDSRRETNSCIWCKETVRTDDICY